MPYPKNYPRYVENYLSAEEWEKVEKTAREQIERNFEEMYLNQINDKSKVFVVIRSGHEYEEIIKFAKEENFDLIVIGTRGKTGITHALLGSVAEKIVRESPVPVLVIPHKYRLETEES